MIVLDAGAYFESLLGSSGGRIVDGVMWQDEPVAPELFSVEVLQRIVQVTKNNAVSRTVGEQMFSDLELAPVELVSHRALMGPALRYTCALSACDALYVALAKMLECPLITADGRLAATAAEQFGLVVTRIPTAGRSGPGRSAS